MTCRPVKSEPFKRWAGLLRALEARGELEAPELRVNGIKAMPGAMVRVAREGCRASRR